MNTYEEEQYTPDSDMPAASVQPVRRRQDKQRGFVRLTVVSELAFGGSGWYG